MLNLSLAAVDRGEVRVREQVPPDHPMWENTGVELGSPLDVDLTARSVGDGVFVRGTLRGTARLACRRCLAPVEAPIEQDVDILFAEQVEEEEMDSGEVYPIPPRGGELDLSGAVREQVILAVPEFGLCREDCPGLCPRCGKDLNGGPCECVPEEPESPWDALKKIKFED